MSDKVFQFDEKNLNAARNVFCSPLRFKRKLLFQMPLNLIVGIKIIDLNKESCRVSVPFKQLNKNPFKSIFWAVLGMAAEMSCGALVDMYTYGLKPSVSIIVGGCSAEFLSKATDLTTFVCNDGKQIAETVKRAIETREPQEILCKTIGYSAKGREVARFSFTWKMRVRDE